jgi:DNA-directed RNA polymerase specialized sigma24 family protein/AraC-like DNA-binding protein
VTVPGEASAVPADEYERLFADVYTKYWDRLRRYLWYRMDARHAQVAEDLAQETFIVFWASLRAGRVRNHEQPMGLLTKMARDRLCDYWSKAGTSRERSIDFADPANRAMLPVKHTYAPGAPHLVGLARDLDDAMDRMTEASKAWRDKHGEVSRLRTPLSEGWTKAKGGLTPATRQRLTEAAAAAEAAADELLADFRKSCQRVGQLRGELESKAGPNWRSSSALVDPSESAGQRERPKAGAIARNPNVTECPEGHTLDLANTSFTEDGARRCRKCAADRARSAFVPKGTGVHHRTVPQDALDAARAVMEDPANDDLSMVELEKKVGLTAGLLRARLADVVAARRKRKLARPAYLKNPKLGVARALLMDDDCPLTVVEIAHKAGLSESNVYRTLGDEVSARVKRLRGKDSPRTARAREMLLDPENTMSITEISKAVGWSVNHIYHALPEEIEARRTASAGSSARVPAGASR